MKKAFNILSGDAALAASVEGRINLIYAHTGTGKTYLALTATKDRKVLYIDIENAIGKVWASVPDNQKNKANLSTWKPKTIQELLAFIDSPDAEAFDLIIVDSLTFLADQELAEFTDKGITLGFSHYGDLGRNIGTVLRRAQLRGVNIDFLMQAERIDTDSGDQKYFPRAIGKTIVPAITERADNTIFLTIKDGKRVAHCSPGEGYYAKHRDPLPDTIEEANINYEFISSKFVKYEVPMATKEDLDGLKTSILHLDKLKKEAGRDLVDREKLLHIIGATTFNSMTFPQCDKALDLIVSQIERTEKEVVAKNLTEGSNKKES